MVNRKGKNFGFGRNFGPKILQKGFRQFRPKNRKNRKSYFRPKQPISAKRVPYLDSKYDQNCSLSAETGPFGRNYVFRSISAFGRNCSLKIQLFRFRPKPFRLTTSGRAGGEGGAHSRPHHHRSVSHFSPCVNTESGALLMIGPTDRRTRRTEPSKVGFAMGNDFRWDAGAQRVAQCVIDLKSERLSSTRSNI